MHIHPHCPPHPNSHTHTYKHSYPTCLTQVVQALLIDREEANGGPILRTHVGDGGPVSNGQCCYPWTKELHKLAHHADLTQVLSKRMTTATQTCPLLMMTQVLRKRVTTATQTCPPHRSDTCAVKENDYSYANSPIAHDDKGAVKENDRSYRNSATGPI